MKKRGVVSGLLLILPWCLYPRLPGAEASQALRDIGGVRVIIEKIGPVLEGYGLSASGLKRAIVARLRVSGLTVPSKAKKGYPSFHLLVRGVSYRKMRSIIYNIQAELRQKVSLVRNPGFSFMSSTWAGGITGVVSEREMPRVVMEAAKDMVDAFLRDYRRANILNK